MSETALTVSRNYSAGRTISFVTEQRPRRTQAQRRASTRARILACTAECLLESGYAATTVSAVQERAGLARGTVQHHFPTRAELLVAATTQVVDQRLEQFRREAELLPPGRDRLQSVVDLAWRDLNSPAFFTALDLWVAARTDAELRDRLVHEEQRVFTEMRRLYLEVLGEPYAADPRAELLVEFTIDLLTGLSMTAMLTGTLGEREAVVRRWKRALAVLVGQLPSDELLDGSPLPLTASAG
ncbi:TetR family transcriptional regulator [Nocardia ignorata]|uniref:TetR family transcriptional regulator n=1 Tax=Nocardia ignorata TaxID=145285 RepID=A0A4R6P5W3_NOCIG|nr:TetR family transcriptional regulator [Nocardia ignorata]